MPRFVLGKVRKFQDPSSSRLGDIQEKPEGWIKTTPPLPLIGLNGVVSISEKLMGGVASTPPPLTGRGLKEAALARLRPHARERQISVLTGGAGVKRVVRLNLRGKSMWFTGIQNFVKQGKRLLFVQLTGCMPA